MALSKKRGAIKKKGGGVLKVLEITSTGPAGTETAYDWMDLGYVEKFGIADTTEEEEYPDETGDIVATEFGNRSVKLTGSLMQSDKELLDFLKDTVKGKYYSVYWLSDKNNDGKRQEMVFGICKIKPGIEVESGTKRPPISITVLKNTSQIKYDGVGERKYNAELPIGSYATGAPAVSILAEQHYAIVETAI